MVFIIIILLSSVVRNTYHNISGILVTVTPLVLYPTKCWHVILLTDLLSSIFIVKARPAVSLTGST